MLYYATSDIQKDILVKIAYTSITYLPFIYYHFVIRYLNRLNEMLLVRLSYLLSTFWLILLWSTNLFIAGHIKYGWGNYGKAGVIHPIYLIFVFLAIGRLLYLLKISFEKLGVTSITRNRNKFVFVATCFYATAAVEYLINYGATFYPVGVYSILISFFVISYTILKYHLMDITLFARDTTIFLVYMGITLVIFVPLIILPIIFFGKSMLWLSALSIILLIFSAPSLHRLFIYSNQSGFPQKIVNWIDRKLFRGKFLYLNGLTEFWEKTGVVYTSTQLAWTLVPSIVKMMNLDSCSFLLFERDKKEFIFKAQAGLDEIMGNDEALCAKTVSVHSALIRYLSEKKQIAVYEELEKSHARQTQEAAVEMKEIGSYLSAPIFIANRLTAVLNLGGKKNKDMFSDKDFKIIKELVEKTKDHLSHTVFLENSIFFSGTLAHDIRSMFKSGIVYEYLEEIRDGLEKESEKNIACKAIDDLGKRIGTIEKMSELMVDIHSSLERFVTGKFKPQRINYSELVSNVTKGFLTQAKEKGIELEVSLPKETLFIYAEPLDVERILTELLTNAVKYTQQGKVSIEVYQENPNEVLTKITDTGKGIAKENLDDIFEPFTRIKNGIDTEGKGIGLTSVRQLLDVNAGRIWVKSRLNEGSSFFFVLPCAKKEKGGG